MVVQTLSRRGEKKKTSLLALRPPARFLHQPQTDFDITRHSPWRVFVARLSHVHYTQPRQRTRWTLLGFTPAYTNRHGREIAQDRSGRFGGENRDQSIVRAVVALKWAGFEWRVCLSVSRA